MKTEIYNKALIIRSASGSYISIKLSMPFKFRYENNLNDIDPLDRDLYLSLGYLRIIISI